VSAGAARAAQAVERATARRRQQPGARAPGHTIARPVLECQREGFLHDVLGGVEIADDPRHRGDDTRVLQAEDLGEVYICQIGRTSTNPPSRSGTFFAHSIASSLLSHSTR